MNVEKKVLMLINIPVVWDVTPCQPVNTDVSKDHGAFICRSAGSLLGDQRRVLVSGEEGGTLLGNVGNYQSARRYIGGGLNHNIAVLRTSCGGRCFDLRVKIGHR